MVILKFKSPLENLIEKKSCLMYAITEKDNINNLETHYILIL